MPSGLYLPAGLPITSWQVWPTVRSLGMRAITSRSRGNFPARSVLASALCLETQSINQESPVDFLAGLSLVSLFATARNDPRITLTNAKCCSDISCDSWIVLAFLRPRHEQRNEIRTLPNLFQFGFRRRLGSAKAVLIQMTRSQNCLLTSRTRASRRCSRSERKWAQRAERQGY